MHTPTISSPVAWPPRSSRGLVSRSPILNDDVLRQALTPGPIDAFRRGLVRRASGALLSRGGQVASRIPLMASATPITTSPQTATFLQWT